MTEPFTREQLAEMRLYLAGDRHVQAAQSINVGLPEYLRLIAMAERLLQVEPVVEWMLGKHICPGCDGCEHRNREQPHREDCQLVTSGLVTKEGDRR